MERQWLYLQNPFLNAAEGNFTKYNSIISYTTLRVLAHAGDAFFDQLIALLGGHYQDWTEKRTEYLSGLLHQKSKTQTFTELITKLGSTDIEDWDDKIRIVYKKGTPQYNNLLGNGRMPFQSGSYLSRIQATAALISSIGTDASLAAVKVLVQSAHSVLLSAKAAQDGAIEATKTRSNDLDMLIVSGCTALYESLGMMMTHFSTNTDEIANFYDLTLIRANKQTTFQKTIKAGKNINIAKRKLTAAMQMRVINDGPVDVVISYVPEKNDGVPAITKSIPAGEDVQFPVNDLGNIALGHFIKAYNADPLIDTHITLYLI